jgi:hypothetical protein
MRVGIDIKCSDGVKYSTHLNKRSMSNYTPRRIFGRPRSRWKDNIKMDLQEVGCEEMDWIYLTQDKDRWRAVVNAVMNHRVP